MLRCVSGEEVRELWSRANEAHIPPDNVEKLRQFVETGSAQEDSSPRDPVVSPILLCTGLASPLHRPELIHSKYSSLEPNAILNEDGESRRF